MTVKPSVFFTLVPEVTAGVFKLPEVNVDANENAVRLVDALVRAALVDYRELTGRAEPPDVQGTPRGEERALEVFLCFLRASALRARKVQVALDAVKMHNPDVQQNPAFNLDLVRVIGRAERGTLQRARKLWRGDGWLTRLVGRDAQQ